MSCRLSANQHPYRLRGRLCAWRSRQRGGRRHPTRPHNARSLGREAEVAYRFQPLFGRPPIVVIDQLHSHSRHLTPRSGNGPSFLVPDRMVHLVTASVNIADVPRLSVARLFDQRGF